MSNTRLPFSNLPRLVDQDSWIGEADFLNAGLSPKTVTSYGTALRAFADWLTHYEIGAFRAGDAWPFDPSRLANENVLDFAAFLNKERASSTARLYVAVVVRFLRHLHIVDELPLGVDLVKLDYRLRRLKLNKRPAAESVVELDQARQQLPAAVRYWDDQPLPAPEDDPYNEGLTILRNRAIMHVLRATAARLSEVRGLTRAQVDGGRARETVIVGKGGKARTVFFDDVARETIAVYLAHREDSNPALFVSHARNSAGRRLSKTSVAAVVKQAIEGAGLDERLSTHDFRHFRATQLLRQRVPLEVVQEYLGHSDIQTTRNVYAPMVGAPVVRDWLNQAGQGGIEMREKELVRLVRTGAHFWAVQLLEPTDSDPESVPLSTWGRSKLEPVTIDQAREFEANLVTQIYNKVRDHWYWDDPIRGGYFRSFSSGSPELRVAAQLSGIEALSVRLPRHLVVWVNPDGVKARGYQEEILPIEYSDAELDWPSEEA